MREGAKGVRSKAAKGSTASPDLMLICTRARYSALGDGMGGWQTAEERETNSNKTQ